ncbi:helix-turn-helix transcriptional regulator [Colwelliaceae bacterium BS250]
MLVSEKPRQLLLISFDDTLTTNCYKILTDYCSVLSVSSMHELESFKCEQNVAAVIYAMCTTSSNHLHNIKYIRNKFVAMPFIVLSKTLSIPLLQQSLHIGVNDLFLYPLSSQDLSTMVCDLQTKSKINLNTDKLDLKCARNALALNHDSRIVSLLDSIEEDYSHAPSLHELSLRYHLSPSRLCHMFKDLCGITYSHYLLCRRLEEGERLLSETNSSITTIAYQLGFSSPSHFCRSFKEHFNITPTAYANDNNMVEHSSCYESYERLRTNMLPIAASLQTGGEGNHRLETSPRKANVS